MSGESCPACARATTDLHAGEFMTHCPGCRARWLAWRPSTFRENRGAPRLTLGYISELRAILQPGETIEQAHKRVRAWDDLRHGTATSTAAGAAPDWVAQAQEAERRANDPGRAAPGAGA